jgi:hypothetical protein
MQQFMSCHELAWSETFPINAPVASLNAKRKKAYENKWSFHDHHCEGAGFEAQKKTVIIE